MATGLSGDDTITGTTGNDTLNGGAGNDTIYGGAGSDRINGGADNDIVDGGSGSDIVNGDAGNDTLVYCLSENIVSGVKTVDVYDGGSGIDTLRFNMTAAEFASYQSQLLSFYTNWLAVRAVGNGQVSNETVTFSINAGNTVLNMSKVENLNFYVDGTLVNLGDTVNPTVAVDIVDLTQSDGNNTSEVTFTFSEAPVNFTAADISAVGGTVTGLAATLDPLVFTATFTADDDFDGEGSVTVGTAWQDAAGNTGVGDSDTVDIDTVNPTVAVDIVDLTQSDGNNTSEVTFTFSEAPVGFTAADIVAVGGSVTGLAATANPLVYTATFTATEGFSGTASVSVANDLYTEDRKSTRLNSSHIQKSRMPSSA